MADDEVDNMLEKALDNIEDADRNGKSKMADVIKKEDRGSGDEKNGDRSSRDGESEKRRRSRSRSRDRKKRRSRSRSSSSRSRSRSRDRKKRRSRSKSRDLAHRETKSVAHAPGRVPASGAVLLEDARVPGHESAGPGPALAAETPAVIAMDECRRCAVVAHALLGVRLAAWIAIPRLGADDLLQAVVDRRAVDFLALSDVTMPFTPRKSPPPNANHDMTPEERDERTIFILQLARDTRPSDLEEFFSSVGHVRDVRIITDSKTRRSKGIAYVEFWERDAVALALGLNNQKLLGAPLVIQQTCAERNRQAAATVGGAIGFGPSTTGPLKLRVSNLHPDITDDMLAAIFEPFGRVERCQVSVSGGRSQEFGFVVFRNAEEGKKAMEQLNGFELASKNIRITVEDEEAPPPVPQGPASHRLDEEDRAHLGTNGRLGLMAKLAQSSGVELPKNTREALDQQQQYAQQAQQQFVQPQQQQQYGQTEGAAAIATQCFMVSNMFDISQETEPEWELEIRDDIIDELSAHGGVVHIYVDKLSHTGNVYIKSPSIAAAQSAVAALHGRWFAGRMITANYVPVDSYHGLFPESAHSVMPLASRPR
ncbi:splicing factor [Aphelenchoides avenae]|nr:splicing factor [Aphelenchus avenae]